MAILVTGGAGYIGSVTVEILSARGEKVVVLDNLSRGHRAAVPDGAIFYHGDIGDEALVASIAREHEIKSCVHFAAYAYVGESVVEPSKYFENNVKQGITFLDALVKSGVKRVVFSSTCATYGEPQYMPLDEAHSQHPANPYGWTKFFMERMLESFDQAYGMKFVALRYFNAAGATKKCGEHHEPETHLIPNVLAAASGRLPFVSVFGNDYPTEDGTAVRDYIHVSDLGSAHVLALQYLESGGESEFINLGNGRGFSVLEVIETARQVTGKIVETRTEPRRAGDPSHLVAKSDKAHSILNWQPAHNDLSEIIRTAWDWSLRHPRGYKE